MKKPGIIALVCVAALLLILRGRSTKRMKDGVCNLYLAFLITWVASCAPQSIKTDERGVEILPDPKFELVSTSSSNVLIGKSFIGPILETSKGKVTRITRFHAGGKFSHITVSFPGLVNLNDSHDIGFYNVQGSYVETATYAYDSGIPGYRYFKGTLLIASNGNELSRDGSTKYRRISTKFPVSRKWEIAK